MAMLPDSRRDIAGVVIEANKPAIQTIVVYNFGLGSVRDGCP
jgi:hypothetical protein